jgi:hypothetical protein
MNILNISKKLFIPIVFVALMMPVSVSYATEHSGLVPCKPRIEETTETINGETVTVTKLVDECSLAKFIDLIQNIINFAITISAPLGAIAFAYAGWLYLSAGGSEDKIKKAHKIFGAVAIGIFFVFGAWLIVNTILSSLTG